MTPIIYDGSLEDVSPDFNAVVIRLDGKTSSDLNWTPRSEEAVSKGLGILWEIDLGLFDRLSYPLDHETQLKTLSLALEHFYQSFWSKYQENSVGICLYRGSVDFSSRFPWDAKQQESFELWLDGREPGSQLQRLYCRDVALEYLCLLIPYLPQTLDPYIFLDASVIENPLYLAQLLDNDRYERFKRAIKGSVVPHRETLWGGSPYSMDYQGFLGREVPKVDFGKAAAVGVYLPYSESYGEEFWEEIHQALETLGNEQIVYRLVSEEQLVGDWDGLDYLIVSEQSVTPMSKRKFHGFCAAAGTIVTIRGRPIGVPYETSLKDWLS
jgi:hypothetical protein